MSVRLIQGSAAQIPLADESVQMVVTSPPYWGLRNYSGDQTFRWEDGWMGPFGMEPTIDGYVAHTLQILREIKRVLRHDGVVFWNIGDSYAQSSSGGHGATGGLDKSTLMSSAPISACPTKKPFPVGLKQKDLCLIPFRIALAAQEDGWWVRSAIIWNKLNPMPESVLDRPTDAYEHIFMFTKSAKYFWDKDAVSEPAVTGWRGSSFTDNRDETTKPNLGKGERVETNTRNMRNVWTFPTQPYKGAHFAAFPEELPRRCILAATSQRGACSFCGQPWKRIVARKKMVIARSTWGDDAGNRTATSGTMLEPASSTLRGWTPTCLCKGQHGKTVPCVVLDPFGGSGTTGKVAAELGREAVLMDIAYGDGPYQALAEQRINNRAPKKYEKVVSTAPPLFENFGIEEIAQ